MFKDVEKLATNIADCTFGNIKQKLTIKDQILGLVAMSCYKYERDSNFKKQINAYLDLKLPDVRS